LSDEAKFTYDEARHYVEATVFMMTGSSVESYFQTLEAPHKELIWFEHSAHSPIFEEPNRFHTVMVDKVLKQTK
jgi:pimeloyl-ACP methyl ester carboxylesterase